MPVIRFRRTLVEGKALGISDDFRRIEALADGFDEVITVLMGQDRLFNAGPGFRTARCIGHDAGIAGCGDHGNIDALFHRLDTRPAACPLLTGSVDDLIQDLSAGFVVFSEDVCSDADEEAFQLALVPFMENLGNSGVVVTADVFEQQIGFGNELHVGVFDAVVDHLDIVAGTVFADIRTARLAVSGFSGNSLVNGLDFRVRFLIAARHDSRAAAGPRFPTGNPHAVEVDAVFPATVVAAARIAEIGIAAVDDDVPRIEERQQLVEHAVHGSAGHDHEHDLARPLQGSQEIFQLEVARNLFMRPFLEELFRQVRRIVVNRNVIAVVGHVQGQVTAHDGHADDANIVKCHSNRSFSLEIIISADMP